jgi:hypothetical protein
MNAGVGSIIWPPARTSKRKCGVKGWGIETWKPIHASRNAAIKQMRKYHIRYAQTSQFSHVARRLNRVSPFNAMKNRDLPPILNDLAQLASSERDSEPTIPRNLGFDLSSAL